MPITQSNSLWGLQRPGRISRLVARVSDSLTLFCVSRRTEQRRHDPREREVVSALSALSRSHHATAVPSSSTIWPGIASRVTPSIVVAGATPAAPNRPASAP